MYRVTAEIDFDIEYTSLAGAEHAGRLEIGNDLRKSFPTRSIRVGKARLITQPKKVEKKAEEAPVVEEPKKKTKKEKVVEAPVKAAAKPAVKGKPKKTVPSTKTAAAAKTKATAKKKAA